MTLDQKKYENTVLYLCQKLNGEVRSKKKLAKLLYFADFDFYEKNQKSITGDTYRALPMGPFPVTLEEVTNEMAKKKTITIDQVTEREGYNATEIYKSLTKPDMSVFDADEIKMLDRVVNKYGHLSGKQTMSAFKSIFPKKHAFLAVVHVEGGVQALRNAKIAEQEGADGIFLINHSISYPV